MRLVCISFLFYAENASGFHYEGGNIIEPGTCAIDCEDGDLRLAAADQQTGDGIVAVNFGIFLNK